MGAWVALLVLPAAGLLAQSEATSQPSTTKTGETRGAAMQQFAFLFRPGPRKLSAEEITKRNEEIKAWAAELISKGYKLDPRALSQETYRITADGESGAASDKPVSNLLFFEASSFEEAVKIAKSHPGARYGTEIEVREWTRPGAVPAPAK
jgi:hypothetical protein